MPAGISPEVVPPTTHSSIKLSSKLFGSAGGGGSHGMAVTAWGELHALSSVSVLVNGNITTSSGDLELDGDSAGTSSAPFSVDVSSGAVLSSGADLLLCASCSNGVRVQASSDLGAANDVLVGSALTVSGDGEVSWAADTDVDGSGALQLNAGVTGA